LATMPVAVKSNILIKAEEDDRISFDDQVVPTALEIIGELLQSASTKNPVELDQFLMHVRVDGPQICQEMIQETINQLPPIMHRTYLVQKLIKAPSA
jgi:hypothetical protein